MKREEKELEVVWREERRLLTLEEEPVLEYVLSWPEVTGGGLGGRWITRYYARLARDWRLRWQREVYWKACLELSARRASARPFTPWTGKLTGETTLCRDGLLSLRLEGEEIRGDGKPCRVCWGDVWKVREGAPCPMEAFFRGERGWKKRAAAQIADQGEARRRAGDCFLDQGWEDRILKLMPAGDYWVTPQGLELAFPQSTIGPAAEGTPVFRISLLEEERIPETEAQDPLGGGAQTPCAPRRREVKKEARKNKRKKLKKSLDILE